jgi:hypothetical protein
MTFVIIADVVSLQDRGKYQGIIEAVSAVTNGIGPLLGTYNRASHYMVA